MATVSVVLMSLLACGSTGKLHEEHIWEGGRKWNKEGRAAPGSYPHFLSSFLCLTGTVIAGTDPKRQFRQQRLAPGKGKEVLTMRRPLPLHPHSRST